MVAPAPNRLALWPFEQYDRSTIIVLVFRKTEIDKERLLGGIRILDSGTVTGHRKHLLVTWQMQELLTELDWPAD